MAHVAAFSILLITVSLSLSRPRLGSIRVDPATAAVIGAVLTLLTGIIPVQMVPVALRLLVVPIVTIVSLMIITLSAERAGLFQFAAARMAVLAGGDARRLFTYLFFGGTAIGMMFTNDAAVLIFTPLVVNLVEDIDDGSWTLRQKLPFYFAVLYTANLVGALIISNPINIIVASLFHIPFLEYAAWMALPSLVSVIVSYAGLRLMFRRHLPRTYALDTVRGAQIADRRLALTSATVLAVTLLGFFSEKFTGLPTWLVALAGAATVFVLHVLRDRRALPAIIGGVGWDVIVFVIGIFIVAMGLRNAGLTAIVGALIRSVAGDGIDSLIYVTALVTGVASSVMNNHPTADMMTWVIRDFTLSDINTKMMAFATLVGGGLGPKMLPIGSLAALIWFRLLRNRGIEVSYSQYVAIGVPVSLGAILLAAATLNAELFLYHWLMGDAPLR